jgi:hypothetical protein
MRRWIGYPVVTAARRQGIRVRTEIELGRPITSNTEPLNACRSSVRHLVTSETSVGRGDRGSWRAGELDARGDPDTVQQRGQ